MRAIENIHRLMAAALAMDFVSNDKHRHPGEAAVWDQEMFRQTSKGMFVLFVHSQTLADGNMSYHAQLDWASDTNDDFSMIPFDVNEDNGELSSVEKFEAVIASTLEFHNDTFIHE